MNGDVTRQTFHSGRHYRSVRQQQGRVQLDADWNEQADIQAYLDRSVTADLVGISGAPRAYPGMAIVTGANEKPNNAADDELWIGEGHYYVDGILCENDQKVLLTAQPDLPGVALADKDDKDDKTDYIAYLDVWFEHLTLLDESSLREVALGGPDTTTRARTIWQVRLRKGTESNPATAETFETRKPQMRARLVDSTPPTPTPCVVGPDARYRRLENQLYRVEVFDPGKEPDNPTFLWSRENGSVIAALGAITAPTAATSALTLTAPGRDARLAFEKDYWVEVTDLARTRRGDRGFLAKIDNADGPALTVTWYFGDAQLTSDELAKKLEELGTQLAGLKNPVARRWDGTAGPQRLFPAPVEPDKLQDVLLEDTIHVAFSPDGDYRRGDSWLIPARTANLEGNDPEHTGTIEWPGETLQPPEGVVHHFADIARLSKSGGKWTRTADERPIFDPLTDLTARLDVTAAGGDGQASLPLTELAEDLRVAVTRNLSPVKDRKVRFTADQDQSTLKDPSPGGATDPKTIDATTDEFGIARCRWTLAPKGQASQHVTASLLDTHGDPTGPELRFAASLANARRVAFEPGDCAAMKDTETVHDALLRLADVPVLVAKEGSNGQIGVAGTGLVEPIEVHVRGGCGDTVEGATVQFAVTEGDVQADQTGLTATGVTDGDGKVRCTWTLGDNVPVQTLTATLLADDAPVPRAVPLTFVAGVVPERPNVDRVELPADTTLVDGAFVVPADLAGGVTVVLDKAAPPSVEGSAALTVALDLPFPLSQSDRDLWPLGAVAGTLPLALDGDVTLTTVGDQPAAGGQPAVPGEPAVAWTPSAGAAKLLDVVFATLKVVGRDHVRGHVRLAGPALAPDAPNLDRWFLLVEKVTHLVLMARRESPLRLAPARKAIALSVDRAVLAAGLPSGITVQPGAIDLAEARKAARRIFGTEPKRPLRLVVDERYKDSAAVIRDGLGMVEIDTELIVAAEPAPAVKDRLDAGETIDGVITDAAGTDPVQEIEGFRKPTRL